MDYPRKRAYQYIVENKPSPYVDTYDEDEVEIILDNLLDN